MYRLSQASEKVLDVSLGHGVGPGRSGSYIGHRLKDGSDLAGSDAERHAGQRADGPRRRDLERGRRTLSSPPSIMHGEFHERSRMPYIDTDGVLHGRPDRRGPRRPVVPPRRSRLHPIAGEDYDGDLLFPLRLTATWR